MDKPENTTGICPITVLAEHLDSALTTDICFCRCPNAIDLGHNVFGRIDWDERQMRAGCVPLRVNITQTVIPHFVGQALEHFGAKAPLIAEIAGLMKVQTHKLGLEHSQPGEVFIHAAFEEPRRHAKGDINFAVFIGKDTAPDHYTVLTYAIPHDKAFPAETTGHEASAGDTNRVMVGTT